jgi:N-acetylglucosaminyldiphosphoundecaprenol N-acetyl-beta-D-mannosaminyltransferase
MIQLNAFGLKLDSFEVYELSNYLHDIRSQRKTKVLYGYSFGIIPIFKIYNDLYTTCNSFDLMVTDGTMFNWFCSLFGFQVKTMMSIPDLTNFVLEYANENKLSVLLFGAKEMINEEAISKLSEKYKGIRFHKGIHGYFKENDEQAIVDKINSANPDILLIGISTPLKERFAFKYKNELNTRIIIPCGGMIDVYSGLTHQTPKLFKKLGLATPYRVIQEPKRLFKLNAWIFYETFFKLIPIALYHRYILGRRSFNMIDLYLSKPNQ